MLLNKPLKSLLIASLLTATLVSCDKDKDDKKAEPGITSQLAEYRDGDEYAKFTYNTAGQVTKVILNTELNTEGDEVEYTIAYSANGKIERVESDDDQVLQPVYNNGVMERADIFIENVRVGYTNYLYENGYLKRASIYVGSGVDYQPLMDFAFTVNANGNITETVLMMANGQPGWMERAGHVTFQYDQNPNPLFAHRDLLSLFWLSASKNNVTVENHFDGLQQPEDKFQYAYQYYSTGIPKSATVSQGLPGSPITTSTLGFIYK